MRPRPWLHLRGAPGTPGTGGGNASHGKSKPSIHTYCCNDGDTAAMQENLSRILVAHGHSRVVAGTCTAGVHVDWLTILVVRLARDLSKTGNLGITAALHCH